MRIKFKKLFIKACDLWLLCRDAVYVRFNGLSEENKFFTHLTVQEKITIHKTLKSNRGKVFCVEIGSYLGASSCFIASAITNDSKLCCIDTWGNDCMINEGDDPEDKNLKARDTYSDFLHNTKKYKNKIIILRKWSADAVTDVCRQTHKIDFLFIDGDHSYEGVKKDWELYSPLLSEGSMVAFHDTGWADGVNRVIHECVMGSAVLVAELPNMKIFKWI